MSEQPKTVKIKIGKGQTIPSGPEGWIKEYFEIEATTTEQDTQKTKEWATKTIDGWLTPQTTTPAEHKPAPAAAPKLPETFPGRTQEEVQTIMNIRNMFASLGGDNLVFEDKPEYFIIRPKTFLQGQAFKDVANIVQGQGGEYISAGKDSHFRIPKAKQTPTPAAPQPAGPDAGLDPDMLTKLPWKNFKTKEPAKPGEAAWIYSNNIGAQTLVKLLQDHRTDTVPVQIGDRKYEISFSGDEDRFITRTPIKQ